MVDMELFGIDAFEPRKFWIEENLQAALQLAQLGAYVFPCECEGNRKKAPCHGVYWRSESTCEEAKVRKLWSGRVAMPGIDLKKTGLLVVDCDVKRSDGISWFQEYACEHGDSLDHVPFVETPSGGRHYVFKNPLGLGNSRGLLPDKAVADIDVRGEGGYVIGTGATLIDGGGSYEANGDIFAAPVMPDWLIELLSPPRPIPKAIVSPNGPASNGHDRLTAYGRQALAEECRNLAMAGEGTRNEAANLAGFRIGRLVGGNCLTSSEAYEGLSSAALAWGISPKDKALGPRGTISRALKAGEQSPRGPDDAPLPAVEILLDGTRIDPSTGEVLEEEAGKLQPATAKPEAPAGPLPAHLLTVPGLVGDIAKFICDSSLRPQPGLALGAALTIVGTAAGRHLAGPTRSGTHLYVVGLAPTGVGKDDPLAIIPRILRAAGMGQHLGVSQFMSMPAVVRFLQYTPLSLCPMDEFGDFLRRINDRRASGFEKSIIGPLRTAWGSSFKTMIGPAWAGQASMTIESPAMSIFGVSTKEEFFNSLQSEAIANGFLNRFLLIEADTSPLEREEAVTWDIPRSVVDGLSAIHDRDPIIAAQLGQSTIAPPYDLLWWTDGAKQARKALSDKVKEWGKDDKIKEMLSRTVEIAIRLATIVTIGKPSREIDTVTMSWASDFAWESSVRMATAAGLYISDTENQAIAKTILRIAIEAGGSIKRRDLLRKLDHKYRARDLEDVLRSLLETEQLVAIDVKPVRGPAVRNYKTGS